MLWSFHYEFSLLPDQKNTRPYTQVSLKLSDNTTYSRVPNKRGGGRKWFDITIIGGVGTIGGEVLGEIENSRFLSEHVSFIYLCER